MRVVRTQAAARRCISELRGSGSIGLVPTMGALHHGHLELVRRARRLCRHVVVSVFVNPTQFGPKEDFRRYPRDLRRDCRLLESVGADLVFAPSVKAMYARGYATYVNVERLTEHLCGASRPGHFRGVTTVVAKLLNITQPDVAVFGQKDAQQAAVIRRMARDLDMPVRIVVAPTVRERDGLALSSRNSYLSPEERAEAVVVPRSLGLARELVRAGEHDARRIKSAMRRLIQSRSHGLVDYIEIVDLDELTPVSRVTGRALIALAVRFGRTRLIDNLVVRS
jgi:pantoate--beta-alanine ligase